jgi:rSAM/selenodomain-associated transferase 2
VISVVVPTLDEEAALPATLEAVLSQTGQFELIVVDGGSRDRTLDVVAGVPDVRLIVVERGRARQMNAGADASGGDWLLFLHADTLLPRNAIARIDALPDSVRAGCFHHRFSGSSRTLRVLSWLHNQRFRVTRVIYGDQAMFVRPDLFHELGKFPIRPMEDIAFSIALRSATRPIMLSECVTTDSRKFDQMGHWRSVLRVVHLLIRFRLGSDVSRDRFFGDYR